MYPNGQPGFFYKKYQVTSARAGCAPPILKRAKLKELLESRKTNSGYKAQDLVGFPLSRAEKDINYIKAP